MTATEELRNHCIKTIEKYPSLRSDVNTLYSLFRMEIEDDCADEVLEFIYGRIDEIIKNLNKK